MQSTTDVYNNSYISAAQESSNTLVVCTTQSPAFDVKPEHPFLIGGALMILVFLGLAAISGLRSEGPHCRVKTTLQEIAKVFLIAALFMSGIELVGLLFAVFG